jgi:hypothetical protein
MPRPVAQAPGSVGQKDRYSQANARLSHVPHLVSASADIIERATEYENNPSPSLQSESKARRRACALYYEIEFSPRKNLNARA